MTQVSSVLSTRSRQMGHVLLVTFQVSIQPSQNWCVQGRMISDLRSIQIQHSFSSYCCPTPSNITLAQMLLGKLLRCPFSSSMAFKFATWSEISLYNTMYCFRFSRLRDSTRLIVVFTFSQMILTEVLQNMVECVPFSTENSNCFPFLSQKDDVNELSSCTDLRKSGYERLARHFRMVRWDFSLECTIPKVCSGFGILLPCPILLQTGYIFPPFV